MADPAAPPGATPNGAATAAPAAAAGVPEKAGNFIATEGGEVLLTAKNELKAATFPKLIQLLTSSTTALVQLLLTLSPDKDMVYNFVLTYRSFTTAENFLNGLIERYDTVQGADQRDARIRVLNVLRTWIDKAWFDVMKDGVELPTKVNQFFDQVIANDAVTRRVAETVKQILTRKLAMGAEALKRPKSSNSKDAPRPVAPKEKDAAALPITKLSALEVARQLTILEWNIWEQIQPWECLGVAWTRKDKEQRAPNVLAMIERFNDVSGWVTTTICSLETPRERTKAIQLFIEVGTHLKELGNLNGVMEVVSGLNRGPCHRLKQSWDAIGSQANKDWEALKSITDRQKSMAALRHFLKNINPPCIPYLGMYLTDLVFIEEGNPNEIGPNKLINFDKRNKVSEAIRLIQQYQNTSYNLLPVNVIQTKLQDLKVQRNENTLYEMSEWLEPRAGQVRGPRPLALGPSKEQLAQMAAAAKARKAGSAADAGGDNDFKGELEFVRGYQFYAADASANLMMDGELGAVKAATIQKLIERLTHHWTPDSNSLLPFLATFRAFCTPQQLLDLLISRYSLPQPKEHTNAAVMEAYKSKLQTPVQLRVFNILKTWIDRHWTDFEEDPEMLSKLNAFASGVFAQTTPNFAKSLQQSIQKNSKPTVVPSSILESSQFVLSADGKTAADYSMMDFDAAEFAQQLALRQHLLLASVRPNEWIDSNYRGDDAETKAPNAVRFLQCSEAVKTMAALEIEAASSTGAKIAVLERLASIAEHSLKLNDFQTLSAIAVAMEKNLSMVESMAGKYRHIYGTASSLLHDETELREKLVAVSPPLVPPMSYLLAEVDKHEAGKDMLTDKLINFEKRRNVGEILVRIYNWQKTPYELQPQYMIQKFLSLARFHPYGEFTASFASATATAPSAGAYLRKNSMTDSVHESPRGSNASPSSSIAGNSAADGNVKFLLLDMLIHEDQFKQEVKGIIHDVFHSEVDKLRKEFRLSLGDGQASLEESKQPIQHFRSPSNYTDYSPPPTCFPPMMAHPEPESPKHVEPTPAPASTPVTAPMTAPVNPTPPGGFKLPMGGLAKMPSNAALKFHQFSTFQPGAPGPLGVIRTNSGSVVPPSTFGGASLPPYSPIGRSEPDTAPLSPVAPLSPASQAPPPAGPSAGNATAEPLDSRARELIDREFPGSTISNWSHQPPNSPVMNLNVVIQNSKHFICYATSELDPNGVKKLIHCGIAYKQYIATQGGCAGLACFIITSNAGPEAMAAATQARIKVFNL